MSSQRFYIPFEQLFTNLGAIGAGWRICTYETGTTTPKATYSDVGLTIANANPANPLVTSGNQVADANGRLGDMFVENAATYKVILKDSDNVTIQTMDPVNPQTFSINDFDPRPTSFWGTAGGTASAYTLDADPAIFAYSSTQTFFFDLNLDCNAAPTMAISGLSALNMKKYTGTGTKIALEAGDLQGGQTYEARIDGTDIVILNPGITSRAIDNILALPQISTLTINTGAVTVTGSNHLIDTEGGASSDDLTTINGGIEGQRLVIGSSNSSHDVVVKNGSDNIINPQGYDITLRSTSDKVELQYFTTLNAWVVLSVNGDLRASLATAGYQYLPTGLLFQWGTNNIAGNTTSNVTLPVTFPTANFNIQATYKSTDAAIIDTLAADKVSTSQIALANGADTAIDIMWFANGN